MDMVFVNGEYKHLLPGQLVPVQSYAHNVDIELLVSSCDIDFDSPSSTKYTMGSPASKITKTYGSIMEEITVATDTANGAVVTASGAEAIATVAQQATVAATAVSVKSQGQDGISLLANDTEDFFTPVEGITATGSLVSTGSVRQLSLVITSSDVIQSGKEIGTIKDMPAINTSLSGDIIGHINVDGAIVVDQDMKAFSEYAVNAVFVIGVANA